MDAAHLHLMLNHFPLVGMLFAAPILLVAWARKSEQLSRAGLLLITVTSLLGAATFLTGEPAEKIVKQLPGISKQLIHFHEEAAEKAICLVGAAGLAAVVGLGLGLKGRATPRAALLLVTALSVVALGLLGWTNNLGGQISHPELRPSATLALTQ